MTRMVRKFFAANRAICKKIAPYLPQRTFSYVDINELYEKVVAQYMNSRADQTVVDVGGGKSCAFAEYRDSTQKAKIIAVDISEEELEHNTDVDEKRVVDVVQGLPFDAEEVDLIVSHSVFEHLERTDEFVVNSKVTLRKGGYFIHLFPCKFAPFALINQALPHALSRKVVYFFKPKTKGICGFPAFYNDCYYSGISKVLKEHDFEIVDVHLSYYQSPYFNFFAPLYLVNAIYEALIYALGVKNLCAYLLIIARKK